MKYGIDIYNEWHNVPNALKGVKFFNNIEEAIKWGNTNTHENDGVWYGFYIFKTISDKIVYQQSGTKDLSIKNNEPINTRFEILDL